MYLPESWRYMFIILLISAAFMLPANPVLADDTMPPVPISGPRLHPAASPHPVIANNHQIFNDYIVPNLPAQSREADIIDNGHRQESPGQGIRQTETGLGSGLNLYRTGHVCNDFNQLNQWASQAGLPSDTWSDHYAGWGAYAFDDNHFFRAQNVTFSLERAVGPGSKYGTNQYAVKIASWQPYAAGFGSPLIAVAPGATVTVTAKYLIFDHDTHGQDYDWASLGIKADATGHEASYVNGYTRGEWAALTHTITAGESGQVMILIQGQSPAALNSNIYFDDLQVIIAGEYLIDCT